MSTPLLERLTRLDLQAVMCPDPQCGAPAQIEDRCTLESTDGLVDVVKVRCSAGCWYTFLAEDLHPRPTVRNNRSEMRSAVPLISVKVIEGVFTPAQEEQIVERLADAMVSMEGEDMRQVTGCVIGEVNSGDRGIGGQPLTTAAVKALAVGAPA
jgi:4-oxalocrotonate tautomerase